MLLGLFCFTIFKVAAKPDTFVISGCISEEKTHYLLPGASITVKGSYLWSVSNQKGEFTIQGIQKGKYELEICYFPD